MKNIVTVENNNQLRVKVSDISKFSQSSIKNVQSLIRNHSKSLAEFQTLKRDGQGVFKVSESLNEEQAYFLLTLMKNSPNVLKFKKELIKQFFAYRDMICETSERQLQQKNNTIKQLKKDRNIYGRKRGNNMECVSFIVRESEAEISKDAFNVLLCEEEIIAKNICTCCGKYDFISCSDKALLKDGVMLIHYDSAIAVLEKYEVKKVIDNQLFFDFN